MWDLDLGQVNPTHAKIGVFRNVSEDTAARVNSDIVQFQSVQTELVSSVQQPVDDEVGHVHVAKLVVLEIVARFPHGEHTRIDV